MRRNIKFLMQLCVCLLVANLWFAPASHASNTAGTTALANSENTAASTSSLSTKQLQVELVEAKQLLQRESSTSDSSVALAAFDRSSSQIHIVSLDKDSFLKKGGDFLLHSQNGSDLRVRIVRQNGVNTAVTVKDARTGTSMYPLTVKYPIEKDGGTETE